MQAVRRTGLATGASGLIRGEAAELLGDPSPAPGPRPRATADFPAPGKVVQAPAQQAGLLEAGRPVVVVDRVVVADRVVAAGADK
jgi:hypothetical protein